MKSFGSVKETLKRIKKYAMSGKKIKIIYPGYTKNSQFSVVRK